MAIDVTSLAPITDVFPYSGVGELLQNRSAFARAEVTFTVLGGVIPLTGVGDSMYVLTSGTLPANFSYSLTDFFLGISAASGDTNTFDSELSVWINDSVVEGTTRSWELFPRSTGQLSSFNGGLISTMSYCIDCFPSNVMRSIPGQQLNFIIGANNSTTNQSAYEWNFYMRWQQFDINQAHDAALNSAIPVRTR